MITVSAKVFLFHFAATWSTTAHVLCAEASYSESETRAVMQVILNRRDSRIFPNTILKVVTQRRQFARPKQCYESWMKPHHWHAALQGMAKRKWQRMYTYKWLQRNTLFFLNAKAYKRLRRKWRKARLVTGVSRRKNGSIRHYFMRFSDAHLRKRR